MYYIKMRGFSAPHHHHYFANLIINTFSCKYLPFFYGRGNKILSSSIVWEISVILAPLKKCVMLRTKKSSNSNMRFLFGSVVFFAVIILSVILFTYYALSEAWRKSPDSDYYYMVTFSQDFAGRNFTVYFDDSLLYVGNPVDVDTVLKVKRYVTEEPVNIAGIDTFVKIPHFTSSSSLFVVNGDTDIPTIINVYDNRVIDLQLKSGKVDAVMR